MGKKKGKQKNVMAFKVSGSKVTKSKHKTKAVATHLKKINTKVKADEIDATFQSLQGSIRPAQKSKQADQQKAPPVKKSASKPMQEVNMYVAAADFSKLFSKDGDLVAEDGEEETDL